MTHLSPAVFLVWSIISASLTTFCFYHLWCYDRFRCLRWNHGPYAGAFKRLLTYTYILSLPLITTYSFGNAIIKYQEGFMFYPGHGFIAKPWNLWTPAHQKAIFPLLMVYCFSWSLEITTHLEELCFWLFLMNANSSQPEWFKSTYFKVWATGSVVAWIYVPLVSILTRSDPLKCETYSFLAGGLGGLALTLFFFPILWTFPKFLRHLEDHGVDEATILRLTKFHELNVSQINIFVIAKIRVVFRLLFIVPIIIMGADGLRPHTAVNESMLGTDLLGMVAAFSCLVQSALTLVIFFPRSTSMEYHERKAKRLGLDRRHRRSGSTGVSQDSSVVVLSGNPASSPATKQNNDFMADEYDEDLMDDTYEMPPVYRQNVQVSDNKYNHERPNEGSWNSPSTAIPVDTSIPLRPNRRVDIESAGADIPRKSQSPLTNPKRWVHPFVKHFISPIDMSLGHSRR